MEEEVEVSKYYDVGIDEDDFVVIRELPEAEFAVVVLVVGVLFGFRIADPGYDTDGPAGGGKGLAFGNRDGVVDEEDKVAFGAGFDEGLG